MDKKNSGAKKEVSLTIIRKKRKEKNNTENKRNVTITKQQVNK
jgi:hypothetical protein